MQKRGGKLERTQTLLTTDLTQMNTALCGLKNAVSELKRMLVQPRTRLKDGSEDVMNRIESVIGKVKEYKKELKMTLKAKMSRGTREMIQKERPRAENHIRHAPILPHAAEERVEHKKWIEPLPGRFPGDPTPVESHEARRNTR